MASYQAVPASADTQDQFTVPLRPPHQRPPEFQLLLLLHRRHECFSRSTTSRPRAPTFPASAANVGSRYQQYNPSHTWTITNCADQRISLHLHARRPADLPASADHRRRAGFLSSAAAQAVCFNGTSDSSAINSIIGSSGIPTATGTASRQACRPIAPEFPLSTLLADSPLATVGKVNCRRSAIRFSGPTTDMGQGQPHHEVRRRRPPRALRPDPLLQRQRRVHLRRAPRANAVQFDDNYPELSARPGRQLHARFGAA